jgi:outer membrane protein TolC
METPLVLDMEDMKALAAAGPDHPVLNVDLAIEHALTHRLDLLNTMDQVEDTRRRVLIAENGLAPDLDFTFQYDLVSVRENDPLSIDFEPNRWSAGLDLNLPLQRIEERNQYRQSIIDLERQKRTQAFQEDSIKGDVRQSYRRLNQAKDTYEIQKVSLVLADKRVESTDLLLQAGRAQTRDFLDAQNARLSAQNALAAAIVEHTIARLNFLLDIEALEVTQRGLIELIEEENALIRSLQARSDDPSKGPENDDEPEETEE